MPENKIGKGERIASMFIDHLAMSAIAMIFYLPGFLLIMIPAIKESSQTNPDIFGAYIYFFLIGFAIYFCKDSFNGRSIGKRAMKLQVVENATGEVASPLRCLVRNIFIIIWPIEVLVTLFSPNRRIGDFIAGTKVVPFNSEIEQAKPDFKKTGIALLIAYGMMLGMWLPFKALIAKQSQPMQVHFVQSSLNQQASTEIEHLFEDSLGDYLKVHVRVFDSMENERLKYVSMAIVLRENYMETEEGYKQLKSLTVPLLLSKVPEKTFVGQIQYFYKAPNEKSMRTLFLDWRKNK